MDYKVNNIVDFNDNGVKRTGNIENIIGNNVHIKGVDAKYYDCHLNDILELKGFTYYRKSFSDIEGKGYGRPELKDSKEFEKWKKEGYK